MHWSLSPSATTFGLGNGRIEALTDGIFATIMTVLVLSLSIPTITGSTSASSISVLKYVETLGPTVLGYVLSFLVLAVFWVRHHNIFHFVIRVDSSFIWLNIGFLLTIGFVPFSTELLGRFSSDVTASVLYGANLIAMGLAIQAIWLYAQRQKLLIADGMDERVMAKINRRLTVGPVLYFAAIVITVATQETLISIVVYVATLIYYVLASSLGFGTPWRHLLGRTANNRT
jgi:uncharacterized membrane protein